MLMNQIDHGGQHPNAAATPIAAANTRSRGQHPAAVLGNSLAEVRA